MVVRLSGSVGSIGDLGVLEIDPAYPRHRFSLVLGVGVGVASRHFDIAMAYDFSDRDDIDSGLDRPADGRVLEGALGGDLVKTLLGRLRAGAGYSTAGWESLPDMVLGLRFAWLSDWLRRDDREMVDLEAVFIGLLFENREALARAWA